MALFRSRFFQKKIFCRYLLKEDWNIAPSGFKQAKKLKALCQFESRASLNLQKSFDFIKFNMQA